jgi:hypothetical protein
MPPHAPSRPHHAPLTSHHAPLTSPARLQHGAHGGGLHGAELHGGTGDVAAQRRAWDEGEDRFYMYGYLYWLYIGYIYIYLFIGRFIY